MNIKKHIILLVLTLILGIAIRFWQLGAVPVSPDWDEVALGYDAYSIIQTGKDEYGEAMPPILRSYDDYKPALYAYLAVPSVATFGVNTFAVRLPSALCGVLALIIFYFLILELFAVTKEKSLINKKHNEVIALLSTFLLAISPWHIQFSRVGFETNVGLTINLLVALFFIKALKKPWYLVVSAFFAALNFYVYQSERVFTPLLIIVLIAIFYKKFFKIAKRIILSSVLVGILVLVPLIMYSSTHPQAFKRVQDTSIFSIKSKEILEGITKLYDDTEAHNYVGQIVDNRRVIYTKHIFANYLSHFDINWLFLTGDADRHHAPFMGLLYLFTLPFVLMGVYLLFFGKYDRKIKYTVFAWFLLAPLPAAITYEVPHAVRTLNVLPIYLLFTALGFVGAYDHFQKHRKMQLSMVAIIVIFALFNFIYFLNQYFVQLNYYTASDWQYGYKEAIVKIQNIKKEYRKIIVADTKSMDRSYMFFLFYLKYPPQQYQQNSQKNHAFDSYEFRSFNWAVEKANKDVLYVGSPNDFNENVVSRDKVLNPDGSTAIILVDPKNN